MKNLLLSLFFVIITIISSAIVSCFPVGDWVSEPLFSFFILYPIIAIELILFVIQYYSRKKMKWLYIQGVFAFLSVFTTVYYIIVHI